MTVSRALASAILLGLLPAGLSRAEDAPPRSKPYGLTRRLPWNDSRVVGSPEPPLPFKTIRSFPELTVREPLAMLPEPGTDRLFILSLSRPSAGPGLLLAVRDDPNASTAETLLEIDGIAYGLAFHPNYERNGLLYIGLNGPLDGPEKRTRVVRYTVDRGPPGRIDPGSKRLVIEWPSDGHNGGDLAFGNDGMLYVSSGDGSSDSDTHLTGQTLDDLLAAVLRIDVDHPDPGKAYGVPKDNPFVDRPKARPELWAYGFRNPWRLSHDRESGQLWVGQNGQDLWEQVYLVKKGANYGWSVSEGSHIFQAQREAGPDPISLPTAEHHHSEARSLTGGRVYRGTRFPELVGAYIYGDWSTGKVWGVKHDGRAVVWQRELVDTPFNITGFGTDHAGEMHVIDQTSGGFYGFERATAVDRPKQPFPTRLSGTGLFASVAAHEPHAAAVPFEVVAPQWADGATMERFAAVPGLERIEQRPQLNAGGTWSPPNGTVLVQTLSLDVIDEAGKTVRRRVETRLLTREQGEWTGYSYRWGPGQDDAELVTKEGDTEVFAVPSPEGPREQVWRYPGRTECLVCHSRAAGFILAFNPLQLDRDHDYGGTVDNQLRALEHIGLFEGPLKPRRPDGPRLVNPYDPRAPRVERVRSYLHVNCAVCHVEAGGGNSRMQLALTTPLERMRLVNEPPLHDRFEIADARIISPGSPERSVLYQRISRRLTGQMPPLMTTEVDRAGVDLIAEWIKSMPAGGE